jgi:hypothetical protein
MAGLTLYEIAGLAMLKAALAGTDRFMSNAWTDTTQNTKRPSPIAPLCPENRPLN